MANPFNRSQQRLVSLLPSNVSCIVFWTKNPTPILEKIELFESFRIPFYFLITLNGYGSIIEPKVPSLKTLLPAIAALAQKLDPIRICWRYDPIILTDEITREYHYQTFETIAQMLEGCTRRCIISFFYGYAKSLRNLMPIIPRTVCRDEKLEIASRLSQIAKTSGIEIQWCTPDDDITAHECAENGITLAGCIDERLVEHLSGIGGWKKDSGQRKTCLCAQSIDIGAYNTCAHGCRYCYATTHHDAANRFYQKFNPKSTALILDNVSQFSSLSSSLKSKNLPI